MKKTGAHLSVKKGKRVRVILKTGRQFIDKFAESKGRYVYLDREGKIPKDQIRALTIWKGY